MSDRDPDPDYLWDGAGPVDPEVARLAGVMAPLRHREPLRLPLAARKPPPPRRWPIYAGGAALAAAAALLLVWWVRRPDDATPAPALACAEAVPGGSFRFEATAGAPRCGGDAIAGGWLPVGAWLETGAGDRARLQVADIGEIELGADSRLALVGTGPTEHRMSLERGSLHAKVTAPPRLFVIDTPSATAIDLGCEYDLEVAGDGAATLRVTSGMVELADAGRVVVVPMGAGAVTRRGGGPGTPWSLTAAPALRAAIDRFDGGELAALDDILRLASPRDTVTLWNLLTAADVDRGRVFDALTALVPSPDTVLREQIDGGDPEAIDRLREGLEGVWLFPEMLDEAEPEDDGAADSDAATDRDANDGRDAAPALEWR